MTPQRQELVDLIAEPDHSYNIPYSELRPRQLAAAQELFAERIGQIPLVRKRADDAGITGINRLADLVPLLFAHTVYKSYPQSFVDQGRWDKMLQWLDTLCVPGVRHVDVAGVKDIDDWLDRLWAAGFRVLATSGTSGKCSFLLQTEEDYRRKVRHFKHTVGWPYVRAEPKRTIFWLGPMKGPNSAIESAHINAENWARPNGVISLSDQPLKITEVSRMAALSRRIAAGEATPEEIAGAEQMAMVKAREGRAAMQALADRILDSRHEPNIISGLWAQHMMILQRARERGIPDGDFHPETMINAGGGIKNVKLPDDYKEQLDRFYGKVVRPAYYGMTELASLMPRCEEGRYHSSAGLIWLVLDQAGERLLTERDAVDGKAEGRFAFVDLLYEGRWGGVITGDKVTIDYKPVCACGRAGPTLLDNITRWAAPGQDDHIGCAGTIDSYVRGAVDDMGGST
jgi:hypothetical protein